MFIFWYPRSYFCNISGHSRSICIYPCFSVSYTQKPNVFSMQLDIARRTSQVVWITHGTDWHASEGFSWQVGGALYIAQKTLQGTKCCCEWLRCCHKASVLSQSVPADACNPQGWVVLQVGQLFICGFEWTRLAPTQCSKLTMRNQNHVFHATDQCELYTFTNNCSPSPSGVGSTM